MSTLTPGSRIGPYEIGAGADLSQQIARGPIPLDAALPIARQIAEASKPRTTRASSTANSSPRTSRRVPTAP